MNAHCVETCLDPQCMHPRCRDALAYMLFNDLCEHLGRDDVSATTKATCLVRVRRLMAAFPFLLDLVPRPSHLAA